MAIRLTPLLNNALPPMLLQLGNNLVPTFTTSKFKFMALIEGSQAPDFTLYDSEKKKVTLSDYRDKKNVLLLFYPLAFTSVCTTELCGVRDDIAKYSNAAAAVFGISVDTVWTLEKFKEAQNFNFPLLSDWNKEVSLAYGALYETFSPMNMQGVGKRAAFIVDKKGILQYAEVLENAQDVPNFEAINVKLTSLS